METRPVERWSPAQNAFGRSSLDSVRGLASQDVLRHHFAVSKFRGSASNTSSQESQTPADILCAVTAWDDTARDVEECGERNHTLKLFNIRESRRLEDG